MNLYDTGDLVRLQATFTNASGVATNPTTVTLTIKFPNGTTSTPATTNSATGIFHADLSLTQSGPHTYRWAGTGLVQTAEEGSFYVRPSQVV